MSRRYGLVAVILLSASSAAMAADHSGSVRALLAPVNEAVLASELSARIAAIPVQNGAPFNKGDTLVAFDCAAFRASLAEARASLLGSDQTLQNLHHLAKLKSAGQLEVDLAEAEVAKARARLEAARVPVERCVLRAPFSGRVVERKAQPFESVVPGQPLLAILDDTQLEIRLVIPSVWLRWLKVGAPFQLSVDETGQVYTAKVARLGARVDAVSQSVGIIGIFDGKPPGVIAGMSGSASFNPPE